MKKILFGILVALLMLPVTTVAAQTTSDSTLQQEILAINCNYTTIETGLGMVNDTNCPIFMPIVVSLEANNGRPLIRGVYDAVHTESFRVQLRGLWYVLGEDVELTADGNVWVLDLRDLTIPLPVGRYVVLAESTMTGGQVLTGDASLRIGDSPEAPNTGFAPLFTTIGAASMVFAAVAAMLLMLWWLAIRRRKRKIKE